MGADGTDGCRALKRKGAYLIAQDKETSVVWGMPGSLVESGNADEVLPLMDIPVEIEKFSVEVALNHKHENAFDDGIPSYIILP